jgi:predicted peroxiredoxin
MSTNTFIMSRDPVGGDALPHQLATELATAGHDVHVFLVENGAFLARKGVCDDVLASLTKAGVSVMADSFAMEERGIVNAAVSPGVEVTELETLVDDLAAGRKVSWH